MSQLIEQGAEVDWSGLDNWTALHKAARYGHTPVVTRLLDTGWSLEARDEISHTPLFWAAYNGHLDTVKTLMSRGAKCDKTLCDAAHAGAEAMVSQLIEQGA